jgi:hypothetical protein
MSSIQIFRAIKSKENGQGLLYPADIKAIKADGSVQILDMSGWNGYNRIEPQLVAIFPPNDGGSLSPEYLAKMFVENILECDTFFYNPTEEK